MTIRKTKEKISETSHVQKRQTKQLDRKPQRECFEEAARELECDEDEDRFNATLKTILTSGKKKAGERSPKR